MSNEPPLDVARRLSIDGVIGPRRVIDGAKLPTSAQIRDEILYSAEQLDRESGSYLLWPAEVVHSAADAIADLELENARLRDILDRILEDARRAVSDEVLKEGDAAYCIRAIRDYIWPRQLFQDPK